MLILAGISIATLTGENGILANVQKAKVETRGTTVEEARDIWKATKETDKLTNGTTAQSLEELITDLVNQKQLTEDEKDIILGNEEKGVDAEYKITIGSRTVEFTEVIEFSIKYDSGDVVEYSVPADSTWYDFVKSASGASSGLGCHITFPDNIGYVWDENSLEYGDASIGYMAKSIKSGNAFVSPSEKIVSKKYDMDWISFWHWDDWE